MRVRFLILFMLGLAGFSGVAEAAPNQNHLILCGGPALRKWEDLRVQRDQHDRWWANFVRGSTLRMVEIRRAYGPDAPITWMVYRAGYAERGREDGKPYVKWITELAAKRKVTLVWVHTGTDVINTINRQPSRSVVTFDFFGHSNKHCFLLDYSCEIIGVSKSWIHENDLSRIKGGVFSRNASCQSWGCHTGESMSAVWKRAVGISMIGARGKTNYEPVGQGQMPSVSGQWVR
ncbi:hypothetical protein NT6N_31130 [Oceaniferula spumae]|uniref:Uncharacterized protein n=1 Tax=Oceaniferula spumae TaxID=2979115 RepID=A0AAT9FQ22_9BACT